MDRISKAADPGIFKDEKKWPDWEPAFVNYLSTIPGVRGVPLSYVVRENEAPGHETDIGNDFTARSIACAPLNDSSFRADAKKVHQLLMNFLVAESAEQWIKDLTPRVNGRRDMEALRNITGARVTQVGGSRRLKSCVNPSTTRVSILSPLVHSLIGCRRCLTSSRKKESNLQRMRR